MKSEFIQISDELFLELGKMITERYGIKMPKEKKIMFQARLQRRLRELNMQSFDEYASELLGKNGESTEFKLLADYISTNKTEFFREKDHFSFLSTHVLPELLNAKSSSGELLIKAWSAGCSNGQEAFSIGITLEEWMRLKGFRFGYSILATDISGRMLRAAREAIYPMSQAEAISLELKQRYFLKSKNVTDAKVRVVKEIREKVRVAYLNLVDGSYPFDTKFDVVFLRNTLIYFDPKVQLKVLNNVLEVLSDGGYLFIGHSESLINMQLPIQTIAPGVYVKKNTRGL